MHNVVSKEYSISNIYENFGGSELLTGRIEFRVVVVRVVLVVRASILGLRPTLTGTKNLDENGQNPFFVFVFFNLVGTRMVQIRIANSV